MTVRVGLLAVLGLAGLAIGSIGVLGLRGKLVRNRFVGVRTAAAMRGDEQFAMANRVAGLPLAVAGLVGLLGAVSAFSMPSTAGTVIAAVIGAVGMAAVSIGGGVLGHRAAEAMPTSSAPAGCTGCVCGGGGCGPLAALRKTADAPA
ncbi:SdpI family protein [Solihabitans fulvus]|uniref:SdpI family protein n=1 Tax=Solihabitans fulvus TaxID=1892852 RepID=A0A5B2WIW7_9PSEU|nr:SdpI family protein [Solihabitans fulvus]